MIELVEANWPLLLAALLIGIAISWFLFQATRKTKVSGDTRDVLDEGAAPAARNQALIDSPSKKAPEPAPSVVEPAAPAGAAEAPAVESAPIEPPASAAPPASDSEADDLTLLKGVGQKLAAQLQELGVTRYAQIAAWDDADIDRIDAQLGRFQGRIRRDNWVEQAGYFAKGDMEGFRAKFGNIQ